MGVMWYGVKLRVLACAVGSIMLFCGTALGQSPLPLSGFGQFGATSNNFFEFLGGIGVTSARVGFFYGSGDIRVEDVVALGQNNILLYQDFASFVHHRRADLKDTYFSAVIGIGAPERECLTFGVQTNIGASTRFKQYTDAANLAIPYRAALGVLALGNNEAGLINLNNKNRYLAFDICASLPLFAAFDVLAGYKWLQIKSNIAPYSSDTPPNAFPVFPGQEGWTPAWADADLTSATRFEMSQKFNWHGPFIGVRMSNSLGYGFQWFFDTRVYPWLFGNYQFSWSGAYLDPFLNFSPGVWGTQYSNISGTNRWGADVDFRCRSYLVRTFTIELEGRYSYASMSGSTLEFQQLSNAYGPSIPAYWGAGNYSQQTPETLNVRQQLWMFGGSLEIGF
jgi:hypothetical protein